jgi:hypothetical protein
MLWIGVSDARAGLESSAGGRRTLRGWTDSSPEQRELNDTRATDLATATCEPNGDPNKVPRGTKTQRTKARNAKANKPASTNHWAKPCSATANSGSARSSPTAGADRFRSEAGAPVGLTMLVAASP